MKLAPRVLAGALVVEVPGDASAREVLALPIYPELTEVQQRAIVAAIADFDSE